MSLQNPDGGVAPRGRAGADHGLRRRRLDGVVSSDARWAGFVVAFRGAAGAPDAEALVTGSGAGLGLAIVRGLIEVHRGRVDVENVENGCQFVVTIPTAATSA